MTLIGPKNSRHYFIYNSNLGVGLMSNILDTMH